ncbi:MAG: GNAT family N-acetyltransferase [Lachnospiraceae bacterium]
MRVIEYFTTENKEHWLNEIKKCDWGAGQYLYQLLSENSLKQKIGDTALVLLLVDKDRLVSFCTFAPVDDIQPTSLSPWIGFLYTFPDYRGHKYVGMLLDYAESLATVMEREYIYISTNHIGLYEKYGYVFYKTEKDIGGEDSRVYRKNLALEGAEKNRRYNNGAKWKAEIVKAARKDVDMIAYCGFSCNHCFLGEWCGGCRSVFGCCSYGTYHENGSCPNVDCCKEKGIDGCYECEKLADCTKGFYKPDNDGANACKAQALFIEKYGKEKFFNVHDRLHEIYDFKKTQEILGTSVEEGLKILENNMQCFGKQDAFF